MKKLLFITWSISYGYGTEKSLADVLNRMDKATYNISILPLFKKAETTLFRPDINILPSLIDYTEENFDETKAFEQYYELLGNPLRFNKLIKTRYDCIIACNHNAPSYFASYINGGAKVIWIRGDMRELDYHQYPTDSDQYRQVKQEYDMQASVLKCFDSIAVISDVVQQTLRDLFGITENVVKISNSVDRDTIIKRSKDPISFPDKKMFVTLGRLDYNKNQILLLKAAKEVRRQRTDFMICLLGDGEERKNLESYIQENDLEENVKILGFIENPYPYMKHSVATVLTSLSEGFSLVLVESVMLNTPVISTNVGVAKELIDRYSCGTLIDYDEKELASTLIQYLNHYDGYKKVYPMGSEYDLKTEIQQSCKIIDQAIQHKKQTEKFKPLPYPEQTIYEYELSTFTIPKDSTFILRILKDNIPYEYLITHKSTSNHLIIFNNGAVAKGNVTVPVFQRHSWIPLLKTSSIFCMDPTLYINSYLQIGWGIGKNESYYLENSSILLKKIIEKMEIPLTNTAIYGTSAGGYLSIIMGLYLKGAKVVADNAQLDIRNWIFQDALDSVITFCFDHVGMALNYKERFSVIDAFQKHNYVPPLYLHVNLSSKADNSTQLIPFLKAAEQMLPPEEYHTIQVFLHCSPEKGHNGIDMDYAIHFLESILHIS